MISTKGRYALRVMIDIGRHQNAAPVSVKDISSRQDISVKYLEQVVSILSKAGLIRSFRGNAGGYKLNVDPEKCTAGHSQSLRGFAVARCLFTGRKQLLRAQLIL